MKSYRRSSHLKLVIFTCMVLFFLSFLLMLAMHHIIEGLLLLLISLTWFYSYYIHIKTPYLSIGNGKLVKYKGLSLRGEEYYLAGMEITEEGDKYICFVNSASTPPGKDKISYRMMDKTAAEQFKKDFREVLHVNT